MLNKNKQLIILILLPILSVLIGFFGVKFYLESNDLAKLPEKTETNQPEEPVEAPPVIVDNAEETGTIETVVADKTYIFEPLKIYAVQAGAFSSMSNANVYKKEMNDKGFGGHVYQTSKAKVYVAAFLNEVIAKEYAKEFNAVVEGAYATAISIENDSFKYPVGEQEEVMIFDGLITDYKGIVNRLNAVMINDFSQEYPLEHNDFLDILSSEKKAIKDIRSKLQGLDLSYKESEAVKGKFDALLMAVINDIEDIESSNKKSNWMMTDLLMNTAFGYGSIN